MNPLHARLARAAVLVGFLVFAGAYALHAGGRISETESRIVQATAMAVVGAGVLVLSFRNRSLLGIAASLAAVGAIVFAGIYVGQTFATAEAVGADASSVTRSAAPFPAPVDNQKNPR